MATGPEVIELLSDDSLDDSLDDLLDDLLDDSVLSSHGLRRSDMRGCAVADHARTATPEDERPTTPDFPSADELLGVASNKAALPVAGYRCAAAMTRQAAMELPSSPPLAGDGDDLLGFEAGSTSSSSSSLSPASSPACTPQSPARSDASPLLQGSGHEDDDSCWALDEIINARLPSTGWCSEDPGHGVAGELRVFGRSRAPGSVAAAADFSDAIATVILDSSDDEEAEDCGRALRLSSDGDCGVFTTDPPVRRMVTPLPQCRPRMLNRRANSANVEPVSISTTDSPFHTSELHRAGSHSTASELGRSSSADIYAPWRYEGGQGTVSLSQVVTRKEQHAEKAREAERKQLERAKEKQRVAQEKQFAKAISLANRKDIDPKDAARDATVLIDPGVVGLLPQPKKKQAAREADNGADGDGGEQGDGPESTRDEDHELFARLKEAGVAYRIDDGGGTPCAVRWEMLMRREWDARLGLFVPLDPPRSVRIKHAMVVLDSARFVALVSSARLVRMLEIWRASLAASRLCVVVLGLQLLLRKAATADAHEFARQMRTYIKEGAADNSGAPSQQPKQRRQKQQQQQRDLVSEDDIHEAVLRTQITCPWVTWFTQCANDSRALGKLLWQTTADLALSEFCGDTAEPSSDSANDPSIETGFITGEVAAALRVATVRSGMDLDDSWLRALTQIPKVTQPVAQGIAACYPTPHCLFAAWRQLPAPEDREQLLANISVASAVAGGRRLGPAMSARIYRVFNEADPAKPFAEL